MGALGGDQLDKLQIHDYCRKYFQATGTPILRDEPEFLQVELPRDVDKELTDRPYYWMWAEATGEDVPPTILNLAFDAETEVEGIDSAELVAQGSYRLDKIFESTGKRGRFVCLYQTGTATVSRAPFLITNLKISYIADRRRDEIRSYGVNLRSKQVIEGLYEQLASLPFSSEFPEHHKEHAMQRQFLASSLESGWQALKQTVLQDIFSGDHAWAEAAQERLTQEIEQLETYYQSLILESQDEMAIFAAERELRLAELRWRSQPRIQMLPIHFGLFYLDPNQFTGTSGRI